MNLDQILSIVRWALSVGGPLGALLLSHGVSASDLTLLQGSIIAIIGAAPPVISFVWGLVAHTDSAKLASVAAMPSADKTAAFAGIPDSAKIAAVSALPDVEKIVVQPNATDGIGKALADPAQTKVVSQ